jgi:hypothetical protein
MLPSRAIAGLLLGLCVTSTHAAPYTFTKISDSTGPYSSFIDSSINDNGTVAFLGNLKAGGAGISRGNGGPLTTIADTAGPLGALGRPTINSLGHIAFLGVADAGGNTAYRSDGLSLTPIATGAIGTPVVDDTDTVAFITGAGLFKGNGIGSPTQIYGAFEGFTGFGSNEIDFKAGLVAFFANRTGGSFGIFKGGSFSPVTIADSSTFSGFGSPAINSNGKVAFVTVRPGAPKTIYSGSGGGFIIFDVDTTGPFSDFAVELGINNSDTIVFLGLLDAGGGGIFTGPNPATNKILVTGDTLFGSIITELGLSTSAINSSGQVPFSYTLANGISGVAVATPVPEPSLILSTVLAGAALFTRRSKR